MSTTLSTAAYDTSSNAPAARRQKRSTPEWIREPLLHFLLLGGLLFAIDHFLVTRAGDPRTIVVGAEVESEARETFKATRNREPTKDEMTALTRAWLDNEVLYREGLAMQLDKGDQTIRDRVIFKALSVIDANVKLPSMTDKELREWFEQHRVKYDEPERYTFEEAVLSGDTSEAAVRSFVVALTAGAPGDAKAGLRVFKNRPHSNITQSYGEDFAKALQNASPGQWQALHSKDGWRAIRVATVTPAKPAMFEAIRGPVFQDWKDETAAAQRTAAVRMLARKYKIVFQEEPK